uniref:Antitoxin n=1 Tax=Archaeoglobus fulgidus TaxID=2234 RepID=A0A7C3RBB2_ARCFL
MPRIIEAIYENGVFKPLEKVDLKEGEKVRIIIGGIVRKTMGIIPSDRIQEIIEEIENEGVL